MQSQDLIPKSEIENQKEEVFKSEDRVSTISKFENEETKAQFVE
jgi:hypothetical protein